MKGKGNSKVKEKGSNKKSRGRPFSKRPPSDLMPTMMGADMPMDKNQMEMAMLAELSKKGVK